MNQDGQNAELGFPYDRAGYATAGGGAGVLLQAAIDRWEVGAAALVIGAGIIWYGWRRRRG